MGQIADEIIAGEICALCMIPFTQEHGYPVACRDCYDKNCGYQKAVYKTILEEDLRTNKMQDKKFISKPTKGQAAVKGVKNFLVKQKEQEQEAVILAYGMHIGLTKEDETVICESIQEDFGKFVKWYKSTRK